MGAGAKNVLKGRRNRYVYRRRLPREVRNDVALLKGDGRVVAARVVESRLKVIGRRIQPGSDDAELELVN